MPYQSAGQAGADARRWNGRAERVTHNHLTRMPLGKLVHIGCGDQRTARRFEGEHGNLDKIMFRRVAAVYVERPRIDHIFAVVQHYQLGCIGAGKYVPEHLIEHLSLRGRAGKPIYDGAHTLGVLGGQAFGDFTRCNVVGIYAEHDVDIAVLNAREVAIDHPLQDVLLMPVGNKDSDHGRRPVAIAQGKPRADDAHGKEIDHEIVERRDADEDGDREHREGKELVHQAASPLLDAAR
jgi:hypothetical protein